MKRNNIIFLDIDGVLASYLKMKHIDEYGPAFIDYSVSTLNKLIEKTNSDICISSSWRVGRTIEDLQELLTARGVKCNVVGKTDKSVDRGVEILNWLYGNSQYNEYIIIDDEMSDIIKTLPFNWKTHIKPNRFQGLTIYDIVDFDSSFRQDAIKNLETNQKFI